MLPAVPGALPPEVVKEVSWTVVAILDGPTSRSSRLRSNVDPRDGDAEPSDVAAPTLREDVRPVPATQVDLVPRGVHAAVGGRAKSVGDPPPVAVIARRWRRSDVRRAPCPAEVGGCQQPEPGSARARAAASCTRHRPCRSPGSRGRGRPRSPGSRRPTAASGARRGASTTWRPRRRCTTSSGRSGESPQPGRSCSPSRDGSRRTGPDPRRSRHGGRSHGREPVAGLRLVDRQVRPPSCEIRMVGLSATGGARALGARRRPRRDPDRSDGSRRPVPRRDRRRTRQAAHPRLVRDERPRGGGRPTARRRRCGTATGSVAMAARATRHER